MPDLTPGEVEALLAALSLSPTGDEDVQEITHRINAIHDALDALDPEVVDDQEPVTIFDKNAPQS